MAVILAAGKGTRMKSQLPKVLHPISGISMVEHVIRAVKDSQVEDVVTIIGNGADLVKDRLGDLTRFALQEEQLGTGHAVLQAEDLIGNEEGHTLVICGDTPLLQGETLTALFDHHEESGAKATILTAQAEDPTGYGRVLRDTSGQVIKIVEQKDANSEELAVKEINTGTYVFENRSLFAALKQIGNENAQGEYYLPDVVGILNAGGHRVSAYSMTDIQDAIGVNDRIALAKAQGLMTRRLIKKHMQAGVTFLNPETVYLEVDVEIGSDAVIETGVQLKGQTVIGRGVIVGAHSEVCDSHVGHNSEVRHSVIESSTVGNQVKIGPYAHLRPMAKLEDGVHIGNFVEVKNSTVGPNSKAGHLAYLGDCDLGSEVNVGCGVIFCNYDGKRKHRSTVGNQVFLGSNSNIVSPVKIGDRAFIAAGSTITEDVDTEALAIARSNQVSKAAYWTKFINK